MGFQSVSHFLIAAHFWFGCYYDWNYVKLPVEITGEDVLNTKKLKFLTYWDAVSILARLSHVCLLTLLKIERYLTKKLLPSKSQCLKLKAPGSKFSKGVL